MVASFRFAPAVRIHVKALAMLIEYANERNGMWAAQSSDPAHDGVYGKLAKALEQIIVIECGQEIMDEINRSRYGFNWGGDAPLACVEQAIEVAMEEIAYRAVSIEALEEEQMNYEAAQDNEAQEVDMEFANDPME